MKTYFKYFVLVMLNSSISGFDDENLCSEETYRYGPMILIARSTNRLDQVDQ